MNNNTSENPSKKKILIGVAAVLFLIPVILFPIMNFQEGTKPENKEVVVGIPTQGPQKVPLISVTPSANDNNVYRWNTYTGKGFIFQYPPDWIARSYPIGQNDVAVIVKPQALPDGIEYPQFVLQTQAYTETAYQNKMGFLEGFNMKKSDYMMGAGAAADARASVKYSGTIPFKITGNETISEPIQDTTILYRKNAQLYLLKFEYEGSTPNEALDNYFNDFIQSFKTT